MITNTIIDEIKNKTITINKYTTDNYETKTRINTINSILDLNTFQVVSNNSPSQLN